MIEMTHVTSRDSARHGGHTFERARRISYQLIPCIEKLIFVPFLYREPGHSGLFSNLSRMENQ
jgi:hypothetical protein